MKTSLAFLLLCSQAAAFSPVGRNGGSAAMISRANLEVVTQLHMFSGAGAGSPAEDDEEGEKKIAQSAASMGMGVAEYKLAMQARDQLTKNMDGKIVSGGKADTVFVERDVNNPPKKFDITITEAGKDLGPEEVSKQVVSALKEASEASKQGRQEAQRDMMKWVQSNAPKS